jgi:hypothetical protein
MTRGSTQFLALKALMKLSMPFALAMAYLILSGSAPDDAGINNWNKRI